MIFPSESMRKENIRIARAMASGKIDEATGGRRLLSIDPESSITFVFLGNALATAGDLEGAEAAYWQGLERQPHDYTLYLCLADVRGKRSLDDDPLSRGLRLLALQKLGLADKIPDSVASQFRRRTKDPDLDFSDPVTFQALAQPLAARDQEPGEPPDVTDRLLPYRLLHELQSQAPGGVSQDLPGRMRDHAARCAPLLESALRGWGRQPDLVSPQALQLIIALLGEIADPHVIDDLLELCDIDDHPIFMHAHWAVWRLGQRFPSDTLARIRSAIPAASVGLRCALVTQFAMLPETEGIVPAACELLEGFDKFAASEPAPFLLFATVECLRVVGRDSEAGELLARYEPMLPERGRKSLREMIESPEWHLSQGVRELEHLDIEDICVRGAMLDVAGEDAEEEEPAPEPPPVKPGRNDPCWCGSGKKYKKCHLAEDETGEARHREPEAEPPAGDPMWTKLFNDVLLSARDRHSRAEFREANLLYFDQHPSDVDSQSPAMPGFFEWYVHDFRPRGDGRTLVEDYLRRRGPRLTGRERALLESWRASRSALLEVEWVQEGTGVELKDLLTGDRIFVHDVNSSRSLVQWDCIINRIEEFEGRRLFGGHGIVVPRLLIDELVGAIRQESGEAGQAPAEYFHANSHRWYRFVKEMSDARAAGIRIANAEGDPLEFCSATYRVLEEEALVASLASIDGVEEEHANPGEGPGTRNFAWLAPGTAESRRSYGHIEIREGRLRLESNSRQRIERGRQLLETSAGAHLEHLEDTFESVEAARRRMATNPPVEKAARIPKEVERELVLKFKAQHYAGWPDTPLPALDGKTPREAVKSHAGRRAVEDLLRFMENAEERERRSGHPAFDFKPIRSILGLPAGRA